MNDIKRTVIATPQSVDMYAMRYFPAEQDRPTYYFFLRNYLRSGQCGRVTPDQPSGSDGSPAIFSARRSFHQN